MTVNLAEYSCSAALDMNALNCRDEVRHPPSTRHTWTSCIWCTAASGVIVARAYSVWSASRNDRLRLSSDVA